MKYNRGGKPMTQEERDLIKQELLNELRSQYKIEPRRQAPYAALSEQRDKWFSFKKNISESLMGAALGSGNSAYHAWEHIRLLTCRICGVKNSRSIGLAADANEVCEALCQTVYDLAMKHRGKTDEEV